MGTFHCAFVLCPSGSERIIDLFSGDLGGRMSAILEIENLRKAYDDGFEALKGVSLDIEAGEIFALLGPNGAGKTRRFAASCAPPRAVSAWVVTTSKKTFARRGRWSDLFRKKSPWNPSSASSTQ